MNLPQPLHEGIFLRRVNRFAAEVHVGRAVRTVHVANSGRLGELLYEGARVLVHPAASPTRSTSHDLVLAHDHGTLVSVDSRVPAAVAAEAFLGPGVPPLPPVRQLSREVALARSRIALRLRSGDEEWLVEVKGCTLMREGTAIFPDAPTARGRRHVEALTAVARRGGRAMVLFVIQRGDAGRLAPNTDTDPGFAQALAEAAAAGVVVRAHTCRVTTREIALGPAVPTTVTRADISQDRHPCA